ncbi:SDR family oxidoreductase [Amycolatopsis roodepoortensis]|uniref:SDR family oxidoreductase n=1 Tax=Amycolatopsis roodepoortensis TaxID=700274 RepID=UPI00214C666D|nr:SDR family oxidoreductase [Amycolatopsis roodepoortensis]UUV33237.1 SDR family oxidoreductase [Amycolatopsis roodepoortensis]
MDALSSRPPKKAGWTGDGHLVRTPHPPQRIPTEAIVTSRPGTDGGEALISEFLRTGREMIAAQRDVLLGYLGAGPGVRPPAPVAPPEPDLALEADSIERAEESGAVVAPPKRYLMREFDLADAVPVDEELAGLRFAVVGEGQVAEMLTARLAGYGAETELVQAVPRHGADGVFHLSPSFPDDFALYQAVLAGGPRWLIANGPADGARGFFRTVAKEYPDTVARVVEQHPESTVDEQVETLLAELSAGDWEPVVVRRDGARRGLRLTEEGLGSTGAAGDGTAEAEALGLDADSVVLLVGGANGITARLATTLASASRCHLELFGRTAVPIDGEEPVIATATTTEDLRAALIGSGLTEPAEIERTLRLIEAEREARGTLRRIGDLGSPVRYHSVDVLDAEAVHRAVKEIHAGHGRLDGIVYAAGVVEDELIAEKDPASFDRVFAAKVEGASTLLAAVGELPEPPKFAVLFGSVAAALGTRGQADYAAANDALEALGHRWSTVYGRRGLTVHWGPWAATGRRGIDPGEGTLSLLRELAWGDKGLTAVTYTASGW